MNSTRRSTDNRDDIYYESSPDLLCRCWWQVRPAARCCCSFGIGRRGSLRGQHDLKFHGSVVMRAMRPEPTLGSEVSVMGNLPFWLGIGAAQKSVGSKELKPSRHPIIAFVVGTLIALAIIAGMFALLAHQQ